MRMLFSLFKIYLLSNVLTNCLVQFCEKQSADRSSCEICIDDLEYDQSISIGSCVQKKCLSFLFYDTQQKKCCSTCPGSQIGNSVTKVCEEVYSCPMIDNVGQQFHQQGQVSKIIVLDEQMKYYNEYPNPNQVISSSEDVSDSIQQQISQLSDIISIGNESNVIIIWDAQTGEMKAHLKGHSYPVIQCYFIAARKQIISFGYDGEVITWNYSNGLILTRNLISIGQINQNSPIDIQSGYIITFGFQGDFYDVNYVTSYKKSYIGHSQQVTQVFYISEELIISVSANDSRMVLWDRKEAQTIAIINKESGGVLAFPVSIHVKNSSTSDGQMIKDINIIYPQYILDTQSMQISIIPILVSYDTQSKQYIAQVEQEILLSNTYARIINILVDNANSYIIILSSTDLVLYNYDYSQLTWNLKQSIALSSIIQSNSVTDSIQQVNWNYVNLILNSSQGRIYILKYDPSSSNNVVQNTATANLSLKDNDFLGFVLTNTFNLIYFGKTIVSYDITLSKVNYVISNLQSPQPQQTQPLKHFDFSVQSQLIINTSSDGQIFIFNYYDGKFLYKLMHPQYALPPFPSPEIVKFVQYDVFCSTFTNRDVICYSSFSFAITNQFSVTEDIVQMKIDPFLRMIIVLTLNTATVFDLNSNMMKSTITIMGQFYHSRFIATLLLLSSYSIYGDTVLLEYPILKVKYTANNNVDNPGRGILATQNEIFSFDINLTCYKNGLVILRNLDLTLFTTFQYDFSISVVILQKYIQFVEKTFLCFYHWIFFLQTIDIKNSSLKLIVVQYNFDCNNKQCGFDQDTIFGGAYEGIIFAQYAYNKDIFFSQQLLHFPVLDGLIDSQFTKTAFQVDYGSFGGGIMVGEMSSYKASQIYNTPTTISYFDLDELKRRIFIQDQVNLQICKYSQKTYEIYQSSSDPNPSAVSYSKVYLIESQYKIVILSQVITIRDYITLSLYKQNNQHISPPTDVIIDFMRFTIISITQDSQKNLQVWNYRSDTFFFLQGHQLGINGVLFEDDTKDYFITYGQDGFIIVWQSVDYTIYKQLQPHQQNAVILLQAVDINNSLNISNKVLVSYGNDQNIIVTSFLDEKVQFRLKTTTSQFVIDFVYMRFLFFDQNIVIYNVETGIKLQEIYGFDGQIGNVFLIDNYIIAYSTLVIQSINRQSMERVFISKSSFVIFKMVILKYLAIMISDSNDVAIKLWNYQTGVMLVDLVNTYYPFNIRNIFTDEEADIGIAINDQNQIFTFNPFIDNISKILHYLMISENLISNLSQVLLDRQNNIIILYSDKEIVSWNYFSFLGKQGNYLPNNFEIQMALTQSDELYFLNNDNNLWRMQDSTLQYVKQFQSNPTLLIMVGDTLVIGDSTSVFTQKQDMSISQALQIHPVSFHKILSSTSDSQIIFFVVSTDCKIYKIQLNTASEDISLQHTYEIIESNSRILNFEIVDQLNHFIILDINGQMIIVDYIKDQVISQLHDHINPIRNILIYTEISRIITCSEEQNIEIYSYDESGTKNIKTLNNMGQASQLLLDVQQNRLFVWQDQMQEISVLRIDKDYALEQVILSQGDNLVQLRTFEQRDQLVVFNEFQVNFYRRDNLLFEYALRQPSELNDIKSILFLSQDILILVTQSSLRLVQIDDTSVKIYKTFLMELPTIARSSISQLYLNIIGVNLQTAFNYTIIYGDQPITEIKCYSELIDSGNAFKLMRHVASLSNSIITSELPIQYAKLNILQLQYSTFQFADTTNDNNIQIQFNYQALQTQVFPQTTIILLEYAEDYMQQTFSMEDCSIFLTAGTSLNFFENTQNFIITGSVYFDMTILNIQVFFKQSKLNQVEDELFEKVNFINNQTLNQVVSLFAITDLDIGYMNNLTIKNCTFENVSLYSFKNINTLYIKNIYIEQISYNSSLSQTIQNNMLIVFENVKNLYIENVTILQKEGIENYIIFQISGNQFTSITNLKAENLENTYIVDYSNSYSDDQGLFKLKNDQLILSNITVNNVISNCTLFNIISDKIVINNMTATAVNCPQCSGSVIQIQNSQITINDSLFRNNTALIGGSLYFNICNNPSYFYNTNITECYASNGGALFLQLCNLDLINSYIYDNEAIIGGGVRYFLEVPSFVNNQDKQKNFIFSNRAKIFGNNIASYPRSIEILSYGTNNLQSKIILTNITQTYNYQIMQLNFIFNKKIEKIAINKGTQSLETSYSIENFQSGDILKIEVKLIDEEGNPLNLTYAKDQNSLPDIVVKELNSYLVQCIPDDNNISLIGETINNIRVYDTLSQSFKFTQLTISAEPQSISKIMVYSPSTFQPYLNSNFFSPNPIGYDISVQFRECIEGEEYIQQQIYFFKEIQISIIRIYIRSVTSNSICRTCPLGMYSLIKPIIENENNIKCQICPQQAKLCQNNTIVLKNGYWRESSQTDQIYFCFNNQDNCIGESDDNIEYCREGYIGPLCEICDNSGKVWGKRYTSTNNSYVCAECSNSYFPLLQLLMIYSCIIMYIVFCVGQMIKQSRRSSQIYYLRMMKIVSFGRSEYEDMTTIYLKCMMHYIFISKVFNINTYIPSLFSYFDYISFPTSGLKNTISCFDILYIFELDFYYIRQILVVLVFPLTLLILVYFLIKIIQKTPFCLGKKFQEFALIHGFIFIFTQFQPNILQSIITFVSCRKIGSKYYIIDYLDEECYSSLHIKFILCFSFPLFVIWAFVIPLTLFFKIRKHKNNLQNMRPTFKYGFFYKEYRLNNYYWEFVKIYIKLGVTVIDAFFKDEIIVKCSLVSIIIVIYICLGMNQKPYKDTFVNKQDQLTHLILLIQLIVTNITNSNTYHQFTYTTSLIVVIIHYALIADFLRHILKGYIILIIFKIISFFPSLTYKFSIFSSYSQKSKSLTKVFSNWRIVKKKILSFIKKNNVSNNSLSISNFYCNEEFEANIQKKFQIQDSIISHQHLRNFSSSLHFLRLSQDPLFLRQNQSKRTVTHSLSQQCKQFKQYDFILFYIQTKIVKLKRISTKNIINLQPITSDYKQTILSQSFSNDGEKTYDNPSISNYNFDSIIKVPKYLYSNKANL